MEQLTSENASNLSDQQVEKNPKGYAPTFRRISIYKTKSELTFEDIDE